MQKRKHNKGLSAVSGHFRRSEDGSFTLEAIIWMPIFAILLALIMNITMVFYVESQMLRVVQDANRMVSLGRIAGETDDEAETETETFVLAELAYIDAPTMAVTTEINNGFVTTVLTAQATDLMPFNFLRNSFSGIRVGVRAQHIIEY
ncbi:TadE/TadG family type IV pilus assembly protein [Roseobacter ponti]|uniref:Pilus assembly protein n=1 Tax=Roseobacter ponti TaxID=1891787 RepID=A0A858SRQ0_9RHOB|nr:TadE/TadG family type IV pilus assembly protein [Roseobacter ponti]QJF50667.1 pilus assembly protein [Roseobacter ponti]